MGLRTFSDPSGRRVAVEALNEAQNAHPLLLGEELGAGPRRHGRVRGGDGGTGEEGSFLVAAADAGVAAGRSSSREGGRGGGRGGRVDGDGDSRVFVVVVVVIVVAVVVAGVAGGARVGVGAAKSSDILWGKITLAGVDAEVMDDGRRDVGVKDSWELWLLPVRQFVGSEGLPLSLAVVLVLVLVLRLRLDLTPLLLDLDLVLVRVLVPTLVVASG